MHSVEPEIWREIVKNVKYEKYTRCDLDFGEKLKHVENETQSLYDMDYGEKQGKT